MNGDAVEKENQKAQLSAKLKQVSEERCKHLERLKEKRHQAQVEPIKTPTPSKQTNKIDWFKQSVRLIVRDSSGCILRETKILPPCLRLFRLHQVEQLIDDPNNLPLIRVMMACMGVAGQPSKHNLRFDPRYLALQHKMEIMESAALQSLDLEVEAPQITLPLPTSSSMETIVQMKEDDSDEELAAEVEAISQRLRLTPPERTRQRRLVLRFAEELKVMTSVPSTPKKEKEEAMGGSAIRLAVLKQADMVVVSPVRRSIRLNANHNDSLPEGEDWSFIPNPHLLKK